MLVLRGQTLLHMGRHMLLKRVSGRVGKVGGHFYTVGTRDPQRFSLVSTLPRPQNTGQAPYSQSFTCLQNSCSRQSPQSTPFPIYQLAPRKRTPTVAILLLCGRGEDKVKHLHSQDHRANSSTLAIYIIYNETIKASLVLKLV